MQSCEAAMNWMCLNPCGWNGGSKGESGQYKGREVTGCRKEPGFYPGSTGELWESEEQKKEWVVKGKSGVGRLNIQASNSGGQDRGPCGGAEIGSRLSPVQEAE